MTSEILPSPTVANRLTPEQVFSWRHQGFTLVDGLLPQDLLHRAQQDSIEAYPKPGSRAAKDIDNFGSNQHFVFPSRSQAANELTLHPHLLQAIADVLDVDICSLRLTQSDLWPKYGREPSAHDHDNADQRIHCDYPNHMLTHPPFWDSPDAVEVIVYLSEFEHCEGATAVVPRRGHDDPAYQWPITDTPGVGALPYINDRQRAEAYLAKHAPESAQFRQHNLYAREKLAHYHFGSVLLYRHDTWHRGTPVKLNALRIVQNLTFKTQSNDQVNQLHTGWSWAMYQVHQPMERLLAQASVSQRCVLGFPKPGDVYWNEDTIAAAKARYGVFGMDMAPYLEALDKDSN